MLAKWTACQGGAIFEPELEELLHSGRTNGTLGFSTDFADTASADVHFLCVGTPQAKTSELADLSYVLAAGLGFGGGCLPKDIRSFLAQAPDLGVTAVDDWMGLVVDSINLGQRSGSSLRRRGARQTPANGPNPRARRGVWSVCGGFRLMGLQDKPAGWLNNCGAGEISGPKV